MTAPRPSDRSVRIGVLGAARIVESALVTPARATPGVTVTSIAARSADRARAYAAKHRLPQIHDTYQRLLEDPTIDAVYIPLPSALHAEWTIAAIDAGKHVLCEKPFTSNAAAASRVAARAAGSPVVVMEAYHTHYHPLRQRVADIIASGEIGTITEATATFCVPIPPGKDIRWNFHLGGGGLLDVGYYPVRALRDLFGDIVGIDSARAWQHGGIDRLLTAAVHHASGVRSTIVSSIWSRRFLGMTLQITGTTGRLRATRPYHPHLFGSKLIIRSAEGRRAENTSTKPTYTTQLEAFRDAIRQGHAVATSVDAAVAQATALDALYTAAGVPPRPSTDQ